MAIVAAAAMPALVAVGQAHCEPRGNLTRQATWCDQTTHTTTSLAAWMGALALPVVGCGATWTNGLPPLPPLPLLPLLVLVLVAPPAWWLTEPVA